MSKASRLTSIGNGLCLLAALGGCVSLQAPRGLTVVDANYKPEKVLVTYESCLDHLVIDAGHLAIYTWDPGSGRGMLIKRLWQSDTHDHFAVWSNRGGMEFAIPKDRALPADVTTFGKYDLRTVDGIERPVPRTILKQKKQLPAPGPC